MVMNFISKIFADGRQYLLFLAICVTVPAFGQQACNVVEYSSESMNVVLSVPAKLEVGTVVFDNTMFNTVTIDGFDVSSEIGKPALPSLREWIEIPVCARVKVEVTYEEHLAIDGDSLGVTLPLMPTQPSASKTSSRNADALVIDRSTYDSDEFFGEELAKVRMVGTARDRCLAQLVFSPIRYNPVSNKFLVYTQVDVRVVFEDIDTKATKALSNHSTPAFSTGIKTINSNNHEAKQPQNQAVRILIVSHPMFRTALSEFVDWKRSVGYLVDTVFTGTPEVGTTFRSIASYIRSQYISATVERPAPTYLILVGDTAQLPTEKYSYYMNYYGQMDHISDLHYACMTLGDNLPDCYYGRLSAQTVGQLQPQLQKILMYEKYEFPDPSFLDRALLVAGIDGGMSGDYGYTHADPAMDYAASLYVNGHNGYRSVKEFKNNTSITPHVANLSVQANAAYNEEYIRSLYSEGAGLINYSAHGQWNGWHSPRMSNEHVSSMSNSQRSGVIIGNCCLTGKFDEPVCFAEALMRANSYCGAAAYIGASNSTYWDEDFYWAVGIRPSIGGGMQHEYHPASRGAYDWMFHTHNEDFSQWATSLGAVLTAGNMAVERSASNLNSYYWQIYHLFGDPSMMPWTTQAKEMPISYSGADEGSTQVHVNTAPYAYTAVTDSNNNLVGAAFADGDGRTTIACNMPIEQGNMKLSSIAQGYKPLIMTIDRSQLLAVSEQPAINRGQLSIKITPNPTANMVTVETASASVATLFSATGKPVKTFNLDAGCNRIDLSALPVGVYFLKTSDGRIGKIAKQ